LDDRIVGSKVASVGRIDHVRISASLCNSYFFTGLRGNFRSLCRLLTLLYFVYCCRRKDIIKYPVGEMPRKGVDKSLNKDLSTIKGERI